MSLIAITGGIGAGKSVVSRILRTLGHRVYDCDSEAKRLMNESDIIKRRIAGEISPDAITPDGHIDSRRLAGIVFADAALLSRLNSIVHKHVREDISRLYRELYDAGCPDLFIETAILTESRLDTMVDSVWIVTADTETRIRRVMARNGMSRAEVERRIASQKPASGTCNDTHTIINDDHAAVLPQIMTLLHPYEVSF